MSNMQRRNSVRGIMLSLVLSCLGICAQEDQQGRQIFHVLSDYGKVSTAAEAKETLDALVAKIKGQGGGTVVIDNKVSPDFITRNSYQDNPENELYIHPHGLDGYKGSYKNFPNVTIMDTRNGYWNFHVPQYGGRSQAGGMGNAYGGLGINRTLKMPGKSMDPMGAFSLIDIQNNIVKGSVNFLGMTLEDALPGTDVKLYFHTTVGLWEGAKLVSRKYWGDKGREIITVKKILWDADRKCNYVLVDLENEYPAKSFFHHKTYMPGFNMTINSNADSQTAGQIAVWNNKNATGDDFLFSGVMAYSSDISNAPGDEGAVVYDAQVVHSLNRFRSVVKKLDRSDNTLYFEPGNDGYGRERTGCYELAMSRPLINLNEKKWITAGTVVVVASDRVMQDPINKINDVYKGKRYPSSSGYEIFERGGLIEGDEETPWDESIVGRYFALDDPSECVLRSDFFNGFHWGPEKTRRWYQIVKFTQNPDNTKAIRLRRVHRGWPSAGGPVLLNPDNYTWDGHLRPLKYVIAPGAEVYDIANAWQDARNYYLKESHIPNDSPYDNVKIMPNGDVGTSFDFEPGDKIEQAVGPEPWIPRPIRIRMYNHFPSDISSGAIEVYNHSTIANTYGINFIGNRNSEEDMLKRKDNRPDYLNGVLFSHGSVGAGIRFAGHVRDAALLMDQRLNNPQPIVWKHDLSRRLTSLVANPLNGDLEIKGGNLNIEHAGLIKTCGISATEKKSSNLRGIGIAVPKDSTRVEVTFTTPEPDGDYSLNVQTNWFTMDRVTTKTANGFIVEFSAPAPGQSTIDWQLIR
ncbi:MAG: hypothetical protein JW808_05620 [Victivallales bacterium]|nr:hypothetical protein [Victivallales bacterium]